MNKVSSVVSNGVLLVAGALLSASFSMQAMAEISSSTEGIALGGGMSSSVTTAPFSIPSGRQGAQSPAITGVPLQSVLTDPGAAAALQDAISQGKDSQARDEAKQPEQPQQKEAEPTLNNEFQDFVAQSLGKVLPIYGYELFHAAPSTFAPVENIPVTPDYLIGPGDELLIKGWGTIDFDFRAVVNRNGEIDLPKVGSVNVAGIRYQELQGYLKNAIGKVFRHFELNVTLGKLRSIQVFMVGQARRPGVYTVSSLSTLVNTLFASGGPSVKGSMRHIEVKRNDKVVTTFDLYDLLIRGDKSKDVKLLPGDVIYVPPIGPQVAISGSVNMPAIYELKEGESFSGLLALAGGVTNVAAMQKASVEQILDNKLRKVDEIQFDEAGLARKLQNGDVITVYSISQRFDNAVKLQGHVASPIRHMWKSGMRVTDILGGKEGLIPNAYWGRQNSGALSSRYSRKEVNWDYAVIQRLNEATLTTKLFAFNLGKAIQGDPVENELLQPGDVVTIFSAEENLPKTENDVALNGKIFPSSTRRFVWRDGMQIRDLIPDAKWLVDYYDYWLNIGGGRNTGLNWDYASIVRLQPRDLTRTMIAFDLGKAVLENDSANNLALLPGDEISIFTNDEIQVPVGKKKQYVRLEGEFKHAGVYEALPGETLRQLVARVGSVTPQAYLFGSELTREATRQVQQKRLDEIIDRLETEVQRTANKAVSAALTKEDSDAAKSQAESQAALVAKMRQVKATGRIVMDLPEQNPQLKDLPDIVVEDGDRLYIPAPASTVSVMGAVYNQNAFLYKPGHSVGDYLGKAGGPTRDGDEDDVYLVRADGVVFSSRQGGSMFGGFGGRETLPGDTIVVPEKLEKYSLTKDFRDWTQIFYQFAIGIASLKTIGVF